MSVKGVLAAAAALREFSLEEIAAFCDERPPAIVGILAAAGPVVERVAPGPDAAAAQRWRVVDLDGLRRTLRRGAPDPARVGPVADVTTGARLQLAEETLVACGAEPSPQRRRVLVATAVNHLRQVLAGTLELPRWWDVDLAGDRLDRELRHHHDPATAVRLRLGVAVARLAEGNAAGRPVPTGELIETVTHFRREVPLLGGDRLHGLVGGFFDLVTAQLASVAAPAVDRLVIAVARRRIRAQVDRDLDGAMDALDPLLRALGTGPRRTPVQDLHQMLGHLPDGRDHAVVYADLLQILPAQFRWHSQGEPLPGALVEVVTEPAVSDQLSRWARTLESDLVGSPFRSDTALIGQAAHVFQELAEQGAGLDDGVLTRGDQTRSELLTLAKAPVWPAVALEVAP